MKIVFAVLTSLLFTTTAAQASLPRPNEVRSYKCATELNSGNKAYSFCFAKLFTTKKGPQEVLVIGSQVFETGAQTHKNGTRLLIFLGQLTQQGMLDSRQSIMDHGSILVNDVLVTGTHPMLGDFSATKFESVFTIQ